MDGTLGDGKRQAIAAALLLLCFIRFSSAVISDRLTVGYYDDKCPNAEWMIGNVIARYHDGDPSISAGFVRLLFHDCFVRGCDASLLLDRCPTGEVVEKKSLANGPSLRGFEIIDEIKSYLERECPNTISCADILAFAARDAAVLAGIPNFQMPAGRRDSRVSRVSDIYGNLPFPNSNVTTMTKIFQKKGLKQSEMVILSGAHSIGGAHCSSFSSRLYNYSSSSSQDPSLNPTHAFNLKLMCPKIPDESPMFAELDPLVNEVKVTFDSPESANVLDASYYKGLINGKGLLTSDQALMENPSTREIVRRMAADPEKWKMKFAKAVVRLGSVDVLVGNEGEVRRTCRFAN